MMRFQFRSTPFCHMCARAGVPLFAPAGLKFLISIIYQPEVRTARHTNRTDRVESARPPHDMRSPDITNHTRPAWPPRAQCVCTMRDAHECTRCAIVRDHSSVTAGLVPVSKCERRSNRIFGKNKWQMEFPARHTHTQTIYIVFRAMRLQRVKIGLSFGVCSVRRFWNIQPGQTLSL